MRTITVTAFSAEQTLRVEHYIVSIINICMLTLVFSHRAMCMYYYVLLQDLISIAIPANNVYLSYMN